MDSSSFFLLLMLILPEYYNHSVDESISPKKCKNIPKLDLRGRGHFASSEWALVRLTPEEEKADHNLLAVQVLVTSDGSSSESDLSGNSAISEAPEDMLPLFEPWHCIPSSQRSPLINTNLRKGDDGLEKSKAANALQRAYSLRDSSSSKKYQNWKKNIQSNFPLLYNKRNGPFSKEASASLPQEVEESCFKTELTSPNKIPEMRAHLQPHSPEFQFKEKATDVSGKIPFYIPHSCCADSYPVAHGESLSHADWTSVPSPLKPGANHCGADEQYEGNEAVNSQQLTSRLFTKNSDTSSVNLDEGDKTALVPAKEQQNRHLNKAKSKIMRKLTLSMERQARALALNNSQLDGARIADQGQGIPGPKNAYFTGDEHIPKQLSYDRSPKFLDNHLPVLVPEHKHPKYVDKCPKKCMAAQPKWSLKVMANAIKKSILTSPSEGLKKSQDAHTKLPLENASFNFPHSLVHPENLENTKDQEDSNAEMQDFFVLSTKEQGFGPGSSDISNFSRSPIEGCLYDDKSSYSPEYNVHMCSSSSTHQSEPSYSNEIDVPMLLERFTLKENSRKSSTDDWHACNQKNMLYSSLRHKKKSDDAILDGPVQRNNVWNLFSNLRNKEDDNVESPLLMPAVPPATIIDVDEVLSNSSKGEYLGSDCLPARKQAAIDYCSSSSDGELEYQSSLPLKQHQELHKKKERKKERKKAGHKKNAVQIRMRTKGKH
ncbi:uncharacterized protein LOC103059454 [Python bivittatus]|uniref:Uncharacterized protein LOC103059454 n=1 Tax=Python bivittatus TaxID=176946 RepID=A0A9F5JBN1_PYTBI|nr:uncharacterized protein LOC103059454 [Python bivittatus]